jgi:hypothetical protein
MSPLFAIRGGAVLLKSAGDQESTKMPVDVGDDVNPPVSWPIFQVKFESTIPLMLIVAVTSQKSLK